MGEFWLLPDERMMWKPPPIRTAVLDKRSVDSCLRSLLGEAVGVRLDGERLAGLAAAAELDDAGGFAGLATMLCGGVTGAAKEA